MPCKDKIERYGVSGPVDLRVVRVSQRFHTKVPIGLMGGDIMSSGDYDRPNVASYLYVSL